MDDGRVENPQTKSVGGEERGETEEEEREEDESSRNGTGERLRDPADGTNSCLIYTRWTPDPDSQRWHEDAIRRSTRCPGAPLCTIFHDRQQPLAMDTRQRAHFPSFGRLWVHRTHFSQWWCGEYADRIEEEARVGVVWAQEQHACTITTLVV